MKCEIRDEKGERGCENEGVWFVEGPTTSEPVVLCTTHLVTFAYQELRKVPDARDVEHFE